jgi:hypothetical protein
MTDSRQTLFWVRDRPWFQISVFIVLFVCIRWTVMGLVGSLASMIGVNPQWISQTLQRNEIAFQIFSFGLSEWLLTHISARQGFLKDFVSIPRIGETPWKEWLLPTSESFFKGFLFASLAVAISVFSGLSLLEAPTGWFSAFSSQALKLIANSLEIVLWFFCLELFRYPLWRRITSDPGTQVLGRLLMILFQGWLFYLVGSAQDFGNDWQVLIFCVSLWLSALSLMWSELSWSSAAPRSFWPATLARTAFSSGFLISLLHVYGLPVAGRHEASLIFAARGPLINRFTQLNYESFLGHAAVLLVLFGLSNVLLRRTNRTITRES